jgi:putative amidoligase enzyme
MSFSTSPRKRSLSLPSGKSSSSEAKCPITKRHVSFGCELEFLVACLGTDQPDPDEGLGLAPAFRFPRNSNYYPDPALLYTSLRASLTDAGLPVLGTDKVPDGSARSVQASMDQTYAAGFTITSDCSLSESCSFGGYTWIGVEMTTPAAWNKPVYFDMVRLAVNTITSNYRIRVNPSCGFHVHVGAGQGKRIDSRTLRRFGAFVWAASPLLYTLHSPERRNSLYSLSTRDFDIARVSSSEAEDQGLAHDRWKKHCKADRDYPAYAWIVARDRFVGEPYDVEDDHAAQKLESDHPLDDWVKWRHVQPLSQEEEFLAPEWYASDWGNWDNSSNNGESVAHGLEAPERLKDGQGSSNAHLGPYELEAPESPEVGRRSSHDGSVAKEDSERGWGDDRDLVENKEPKPSADPWGTIPPKGPGGWNQDGSQSSPKSPESPKVPKKFPLLGLPGRVAETLDYMDCTSEAGKTDFQSPKLKYMPETSLVDPEELHLEQPPLAGGVDAPPRPGAAPSMRNIGHIPPRPHASDDPLSMYVARGYEHFRPRNEQGQRATRTDVISGVREILASPLGALGAEILDAAGKQQGLNWGPYITTSLLREVSSGKLTVEIRMGSATMDPDWVVAWAGICTRMLEFSRDADEAEWMRIIRLLAWAQEEGGQYDVLDLLVDIGAFEQLAAAEARLREIDDDFNDDGDDKVEAVRGWKECPTEPYPSGVDQGQSWKWNYESNGYNSPPGWETWSSTGVGEVPVAESKAAVQDTQQTKEPFLIDLN